MKHEHLKELAEVDPLLAEELQKIEEAIAAKRHIPISFNDGNEEVPYIPDDINVPDIQTILENVEDYTSGWVIERLCEYIEVLENTLRGL